MNVLQYIKQNFESFTDREKSIADYLLSNKKSKMYLCKHFTKN